jgi:putative endonuclease
MAEHNETGKQGETEAATYLEKKGYTILDTNWRNKNLEVDIIALDKKTLVITEVKSRSGKIVGEVEEWVNKQKQKNLIKAANIYLEEKQLDYEIRFDIITVIFSATGAVVNHIEDAFYPIV